jgi:hypothetical protein
MTLRADQVDKKDQVLAYIARSYPANPSGTPRWRMDTFDYSPPLPEKLSSYGQLAAFNIKLEYAQGDKFRVYLVANDQTRWNVGTITSHS